MFKTFDLLVQGVLFSELAAKIPKDTTPSNTEPDINFNFQTSLAYEHPQKQATEDFFDFSTSNHGATTHRNEFYSLEEFFTQPTPPLETQNHHDLLTLGDVQSSKPDEEAKTKE